MNTKRVNAAAGVILAAQKQRNTASGIAMALEAAGLLQSPESAAELVALRTRYDGLDKISDEVMAERDAHSDALDRFALAVAPEEVIGEHSSGNNPWANAFELVTPAAEVDALRARVAELEAETADANCSGAAIDHDETGVCNHAPTSPEDPHDSPLHHTYAIPRDLPEVCHCGHTALTHRPDGCIADAYHSGLLGLCGCMAAVTA